MAASTSSTVVALGQSRPMREGQSRKRLTTQDCGAGAAGWGWRLWVEGRAQRQWTNHTGLPLLLRHSSLPKPPHMRERDVALLAAAGAQGPRQPRCPREVLVEVARQHRLRAGCAERAAC